MKLHHIFAIKTAFFFAFHCIFPATPKMSSNHDNSSNTDATAATTTAEEKQQQRKGKHDDGAADLEKVTDYAEEKEILSTSTDLEDAIATIRE